MPHPLDVQSLMCTKRQQSKQNLNLWPSEFSRVFVHPRAKLRSPIIFFEDFFVGPAKTNKMCFSARRPPQHRIFHANQKRQLKAVAIDVHQCVQDAAGMHPLFRFCHNLSMGGIFAVRLGEERHRSFEGEAREKEFAQIHHGRCCHTVVHGLR